MLIIILVYRVDLFVYHVVHSYCIYNILCDNLTHVVYYKLRFGVYRHRPGETTYYSTVSFFFLIRHNRSDGCGPLPFLGCTFLKYNNNSSIVIMRV